jgi:hypothetical protein
LEFWLVGPPKSTTSASALYIGSPDADFVKKEYLQFCKRQKLKSAIFQSVDLLQSGKYDEVGTIIQDALRAGLENNLGHDYFLDILYVI